MTSITVNCKSSFIFLFSICHFLLWTQYSWSMHIMSRTTVQRTGRNWPGMYLEVNILYLNDFKVRQNFPQICQPKTCCFAWGKLWLPWSFCVIMDYNNFIKYSLISKKLVAVFRVECSAIIINVLWKAN